MISMRGNKAATKCGVRIKSRVKAGLRGINLNHNQAATGLRVKSRVRAGGMLGNHSQPAKGLRVKSAVKAGRITLTDILVSG